MPEANKIGYKYIFRRDEQHKRMEKDKKRLPISKEYILLFVIILAQITVLVWYGMMKQGYYVDEVWSYGLANSYYHPHVYSDGTLDNWVSGDYFREYLEVAESERFQYDSVIFNQKNDVHPPLFYIILHTICSFFPNSFSKWYVIIPNIFYFCVCMILLYKLGKILFHNSFQALLPVIAYGLCPGSISCVVFLRMYVLLNVWTLYTFYLHSKWIKLEHVDLKELLKLMFVSYLGIMSHYYYLIFAFFTSVYYVLFLFLKRRVKEIIPYAFAMAGSFILVLITFPTAFVHLFFGHRGREAISNLKNMDNFFVALKTFYKTAIEDTMANCEFLLWILFISSVVIFVREFIFYKKEKKVQFYISIMAIFVVSAYIIVIAKIAPFYVDRYIFCIYPLISLIFAYLLFYILQNIKLNVNLCQLVVIAVALCINAKGIFENRIHYIYPEAEGNIEIMEEHSGDDCIYISHDYYKLTGNALELKNMGRVLAMIPERVETLSEIINPSVKEMIVYVDEGYDQKKIMEEFCEAGGFKTYELLFVSRCYAYVVEK